LIDVKSLLIEQERLHESRGESRPAPVDDLDSALHAYQGRARSGGKGKARRTRGSDSDSDSGFSWGNPHSERGCWRCGKDGHIAAKCIYDMPSWRRDEVLRESAKRANKASRHSPPPHKSSSSKSHRRETAASSYVVAHISSPSSSDSESSSDEADAAHLVRPHSRAPLDDLPCRERKDIMRRLQA
ncbi:hypothetical protein PLICRDRAFT_176528, partial [Plicaturopsis crispa FD-325 SS-3]